MIRSANKLFFCFQIVKKYVWAVILSSTAPKSILQTQAKDRFDRFIYEFFVCLHIVLRRSGNVKKKQVLYEFVWKK
jgi:hypothetical protein